MKRKHQIAVIASLAFCLVISVFMSSCKCNRAKKAQMALITSEKFEPYLKDYAEEVCNEKWGKNSILGWSVESCEKRGEITLTNKSDCSGKYGSGVYHVVLQGPLKINRGSVNVTVSGMINIADDGSFSFVKETGVDFSDIDNLKEK